MKNYFYIVIGGSNNDDIVKWGENNELGLSKCYRAIEKENNILLIDYNKILNKDNIYAKFYSYSDYLKWLRNESGYEYYKREEDNLIHIKDNILYNSKEDLICMLNRNISNSNFVFDILSKSDIYSLNLNIDNKLLFENYIYKSNIDNLYLLESRLFDKNDNLIDTYLQIFNDNFKEIDDYVDDVWSYSEWERII